MDPLFLYLSRNRNDQQQVTVKEGTHTTIVNLSAFLNHIVSSCLATGEICKRVGESGSCRFQTLLLQLGGRATGSTGNVTGAVLQ